MRTRTSAIAIAFLLVACAALTTQERLLTSGGIGSRTIIAAQEEYLRLYSHSANTEEGRAYMLKEIAPLINSAKHVQIAYNEQVIEWVESGVIEVPDELANNKEKFYTLMVQIAELLAKVAEEFNL